MSGYIFDNAAEQPTAQRFGSLETLYDPRTIRFLEMTGVGPGWRCLEIGGGGGSIATWLADRVGETGHVLVTDIDPRFLTALTTSGRPNIEIRRHDVTADPLPEGAFGLIHARLVFVHLPTARAALARLVAALRPGGWLVIEDFDTTLINRSFLIADPADAATTEKALGTFGRMQAVRGTEREWGRQLYLRFVDLGLIEVGMEGHLAIWPAGSAGAQLDRAILTQVRDEAIATGMVTAEEIDRVLALRDDPAFVVSSPMMFTAWGRRP